MYYNNHSFAETRTSQAALEAAVQAKAHTVGDAGHYAVRSSLVDQLRSEAASALFSLGAWIKPRQQARNATPVQLRPAADGGLAN
ncbi:MAG: hypothetical protein KF701_08570 [Anaerolineales bacterium]|nr:hypothetical protein [Anaerolineales bacterium]QYK50441.1 MAG: hypothetical protein KF701_08570 [Anaerolineales bacterium]